MRKLTILSVFLLTFIFAGAQQRVGVAGGLHKSSVSPFFALQTGASSQLMEAKSGSHFGFFADMPIQNVSNWYFQPGIFYTNKGSKQQQAFDPALSKLTYYTYSQSLNYFEVPLNFIYKFTTLSNKRFIAGGGPFASMFYSGNVSYSSLDTLGDLKLDINRDLQVGKGNQEFRVLHYGLNLLAGIEFGKAYLTVNYSKGFTPYYQQGKDKYKHSSFGLTLGIFLTTPKEDDRSAKDRIYYCPRWW